MNEKRLPLTNEEPAHKKKSTSKGLPRSKHKHQYETVLLSYYSRFDLLNNGTGEIREERIPTQVCTICGRIGYTDNDPSYYTLTPIEHLPFNIQERVLSEKALALPKWYTDDWFDKFAKIKD
jgi:hypothetical protein